MVRPKTKRRSKELIQPISKDEAQRVMSEYAQWDSKVDELTAQENQEIHNVRDKYAKRINEAKNKREELEKKLQAFSESNRNLFINKRHIEFAHGKIGFRVSPPSVAQKHGWKVAATIQAIKDNELMEYITTKESVDKAKILADKNQLEKEGVLEKVGLKIKQVDKWYVELKKEDAKTEAAVS